MPIGSLSMPRRRSRRSPHGERGLKLECGHELAGLLRRSPHGERGLKCVLPIEA